MNPVFCFPCSTVMEGMPSLECNELLWNGLHVLFLWLGPCNIEDLTVGVCPMSPPSLPIRIIDQASASSVTLQFLQNFKSTPLSWIATDCINPYEPMNQDGDPTGTDSGNPTCSDCCPKREDVIPGILYQRVCLCKDGYATVAVYIHDGGIADSGPLDYPVPSHCQPSSDASKKCRFLYKIPCGCGVSALSLTDRFRFQLQQCFSPSCMKSVEFWLVV